MDKSSLDVLFKEELVSQEQSQLFSLISIDIDSDTTNLVGVAYIVDSNYDVTYDGVAYSSFPCKVTSSIVTNSGEAPSATLTVANPDRVFQAYLENYKGLRKRPVVVKQVYAKFLDYIYTVDSEGNVTTEVNPTSEPESHVYNYYIIDSHVSKADSIVFTLTASADLDIKLPRGRFNSRSCRFDYKEVETCGYTGDLPTCKKDIADCILHDRERYFGGFPGIPTGIRRLRL